MVEKVHCFQRRWFLVLIISGLAIFLAADWVLTTTSNLNLVPMVILIEAFVMAALLHSLWDIAGSISTVMGPAFAILDFIGLIIIATVSVWLLIRYMREAFRAGRMPSASANPRGMIIAAIILTPSVSSTYNRG